MFLRTSSTKSGNAVDPTSCDEVLCTMHACGRKLRVPFFSSGSNLGNVRLNAVNREKAKAANRLLFDYEQYLFFYHCPTCALSYCLDCSADKFPHLGTKNCVGAVLAEIQSGSGRSDLDLIARPSLGASASAAVAGDSPFPVGPVEVLRRYLGDEEARLQARCRLIRIARDIAVSRRSI